jgi:DNA-binding CsgD family transcriptional regulator
VSALVTGDWDQVLAVADETAGTHRKSSYIDALVAAMGIEVLVNRGRLAEAGERLEQVRGDLSFGHMVSWARAGWLLDSGDPGAAVTLLADAERQSVGRGSLAGREMLLERRAAAELALGDRDAARLTLRRFRRVSAQIATAPARMLWLLSDCAVRSDPASGLRALELAQSCDVAFLTARGQLLVGSLDPGRSDLLPAAYRTFQQLGATPWQQRTERAMRAAKVPVRAGAAELSPRDRELIDLIASGATNVQAAAALHVTEKAIEARLTRLYQRTGLRSRVELVTVHRNSASGMA